MAWLGWRLTRPPTAEALYATIADAVEANGTNDLRDIADEIEDFLTRFPQHERADDVQAYADELELQKMERQLRTHASLRDKGAAHPAATVYAEAVAIGDADPARATKLLEGLVALYQPTGSTAAVDEEDRAYVVLAQRQLNKLRRTIDQEASEQLPALRERLAAARRLEASAPEQARKMYRAVVDLYGNRPWAASVVAEAAQRLQGLSQDQ